MDKDKLYLIHGHDPKAMALELCRRLDPAAGLGPETVVGLKPNLVVAKPASSGATTSTGLVEGLVEYLKDRDLSRIWVMESSGVGHSTARAFKATGLDRVAARYGLELIDLKKESSAPVREDGFETRIFERLERVDFLINLPVIKAHCQTRITCALKNLKGLIPDSEKRRYHSLGLHEPIARLNRLVSQDLILADGIQGDLSFEEGGTPVRMDRLVMAADPVLLDSYVAQSLGHPWQRIEHLARARELNVGRALTSPDQVIEINSPQTPPGPFTPDRRLDHLARWVEAREACSICYGSLLFALDKLDRRGRLRALNTGICVGQGFKDREGMKIGIGSCAAGAEKNLPGCPPFSSKMVDYLDRILGPS